MKPTDPRALPSTMMRDTLIAVVSGAIVLGFITLGIITMSSGKPFSNQVTGTIIEKVYTGEREREITYGKGGLKTQETDSGYGFKVKVEGRDEPYEVPVTKTLWDSKKVGDQQTFIRPKSEQK